MSQLVHKKWGLSPFSFLILLSITSPAYCLEASSASLNLEHFTILDGAGAVSSTNTNTEITAVGESVVSLEESLSTKFRALFGQLYLFLPIAGKAKVISDLRARTDVLGEQILESTWQKDADPYFYWQILIEPPELLEGFSVSLDVSPDAVIDTAFDYYQFPDDDISSGKHTFFVLPFAWGGAAEVDSLLSFELWVDKDLPLVNQLSPAPGTVTTDKNISISCSLSDAHSGLDLNLTTLTLDNQPAQFDYDTKTELLKFQPATALTEGKHTVLLKAYDLAGNSVVKGWDFIVDTQSPSGSILLNNGEEVTNSAYVFINIQAEDATSGIKSIYISNDGVFDTELNHPYPYSPVIYNWLLPEPDVDGTKTVYVKFQDFADNLSETLKDEITLKLLSPDTRIISGPTSVTESTEANFKYEASKSGCQFSYKLDNLAWSDWLSSQEASFSGLSEGNHYFYVKSSFDLNGDGNITIDEEDATPAQWVWTIKPEGALEKLRHRILFWRR